ncbi:hypothetical protein AB0M02_00055 [Actinoplanes sp. NPDC051861]|uniref:hypothetical protein n=1 Tax=Actinoplanes sp. NPDC051861 TaxID=3155170 RepID=UPI0034491B06
MRSLGTRRAALVAGAATVAVLALGGCSAGQVAETAILDTPIAGVDTETADGSVFVRNLQIQYNGVKGYAAGANAPVELSLYNQTNEPVTVAISSRPLERAQVVSASQVGLVSAAAATTPATEASEPAADASEPATGESAEPGASSAPATPAPTVAPARVEIPAQGSALFRPGDAKELQVIGLSEELVPGTAVNLVFEFSNGAPSLELQAPVAIPLSPAPRVAGETGEGEAEGH